MRQNRVDPFGSFIKTEARGSLWGNRGALHNDKQEILRPFKLEQWITCTLSYKGIRREIMGPNRLTELFFLDEATSFAAGHRPCALCRRPFFDLFKRNWLVGNPDYGLSEKSSIKLIDHILHKERMTGTREKRVHVESPDELPDGTFVVYQARPHVVKNQQWKCWTPAGYETPIAIPAVKTISVLTPLSVVNAFRQGYFPVISDQVAIDH